MQRRKTIIWQDPLAMACGVSGQKSWALLYSGLNHGFTGRYSILALQADETITSADFSQFSAVLSENNKKFENAWFGYLGYGLKDSLEKLPPDLPANMDMPDLYMVKYRLILLFDHLNKTVEIWSADESDLQYLPQVRDVVEPEIAISNLASNMTKDLYIQNVDKIKEAIRRGDLYQANLTRKFFGNINKSAKPIDIFCKLCRISPAPYSVFMKLEDKYILSSSPERFLYVNSYGEVDTRPIKGSAPRFANSDEDLKSKTALEHSEKDRAENLMIVDLSRNDLSRGCVAGTVCTENLFEVTSYATVHHMASTVKGRKSPDVSTIDLVKGCFPPGSMTGAPKIKAMQLCTELEQLKRVIYSGAIGWFGGDGSCDLSVVIRTIIIDGDNFEFQVGGAIVSDSTAENEWKETLTKAKAIAMTLGIAAEDLAGL